MSARCSSSATAPFLRTNTKTSYWSLRSSRYSALVGTLGENARRKVRNTEPSSRPGAATTIVPTAAPPITSSSAGWTSVWKGPLERETAQHRPEDDEEPDDREHALAGHHARVRSRRGGWRARRVIGTDRPRLEQTHGERGLIHRAADAARSQGAGAVRPSALRLTVAASWSYTDAPCPRSSLRAPARPSITGTPARPRCPMCRPRSTAGGSSCSSTRPAAPPGSGGGSS